MSNNFKPAGFDSSLYRIPVNNKDSYGNGKIILKYNSPTRIDESKPYWRIKK